MPTSVLKGNVFSKPSFFNNNILDVPHFQTSKASYETTVTPGLSLPGYHLLFLTLPAAPQLREKSGIFYRKQ